MEIIGTIKEFYKAVKAIPELEWLVDVEEKEIEPDEDFHDAREGKSNEKLTGHLYLVMSNKQAMNQLLAQWHRFNSNAKFDNGFTKWRDLFANLKEIRLWDAKDRIEETGLLTSWQERIYS